MFNRWSGKWDTDSIVNISAETTHRVHPDDEHLQYGPVSTALREAAETGEFPYTVTGLMAEAAVRYESEFGVVWEDDYTTFLLILAEALADEGL